MADDLTSCEPSSYDVVVIGAGPAGENVAQYASQGTDLTTVLVEGAWLVRRQPDR